jgi:hypothetical protein
MGRHLVWVLTSLVVIVAASSAQDEPQVFGDCSNGVSVGAGNFTPSTGQGGLMVYGGWYHQIAPRVLVSAELAYTEFRSQIFSIDNVRFSTVSFQTAFKYVIPTGAIQPHIGLYVILGLNAINEDDLRSSGIILQNSIVRSYGVGALAGVTVAVSENFFLFADGRYGGDWMATELQEVMSETRNLGGFTALGGAIIVF